MAGPDLRKGFSGGYLPGKLGDPLGVNAKPTTVDTSDLYKQQGAAQDMGDQAYADYLANKGDKTDQDQSAEQQRAAIVNLRNATSGAFSSAGQRQLQQQAQIDAARQGALARAIGGHSAGGAAYRAAQGAADTLGNAKVNSAALGAQEQANARGQLAQALAQARGQDVSAYQNDVNDRNALLAAQIAQQQTQAQIAAARAQAQLQQAGVQAQIQGAQAAGAGAGLGQILNSRGSGGSANPYAGIGDGTGSDEYAPVGEPVLSDRRAKTNIHLASAIRGRAY